MKFAAFVVLLAHVTLTLASDLTKSEWLTVAMCRSACAQKYVDGPFSDSECIDSTHCYMCWQMCERVHTPVWAALCLPSRSNLCTEGCRLACDFTASAHVPSAALTSTSWHFTKPSYVSIHSDDQLIIDWTSPTLVDPQQRPATRQGLVYAVFWRYDRQSEWKLACMTGERWSTIDGPHMDYTGLTFHLLAVLPTGPVADDTIHVNYEMEIREDEEFSGYTDDFLQQDPDSILNVIQGEVAAYPDTTSNTPMTSTTTKIVPSPTVYTDLHLGIKIEEIDGSLRGNLSWRGVDHDATPMLYTVSWTRESCQVQDSLPECRLSNIRLVSLREQYTERQMYTLLPGLTFNSKYHLELSASGGATHSLVFYTPRCSELSEDFTLCRSNDRFGSLFLPSVTAKDVRAAQTANQVPLYATLAACLVLGVIMVTVTVLLVRNQQQLRSLINSKAKVWRERARSIRSSIHSGASSFRSSLSSRSVSFRESVRRMRTRKCYSPTATNEVFGETTCVLTAVSPIGDENAVMEKKHMKVGDKKSVSFDLQDVQTSTPVHHSTRPATSTPAHHGTPAIERSVTITTSAQVTCASSDSSSRITFTSPGKSSTITCASSDSSARITNTLPEREPFLTSVLPTRDHHRLSLPAFPTFCFDVSDDDDVACSPVLATSHPNISQYCMDSGFGELIC